GRGRQAARRRAVGDELPHAAAQGQGARPGRSSAVSGLRGKDDNTDAHGLTQTNKKDFLSLFVLVSPCSSVFLPGGRGSFLGSLRRRGRLDPQAIAPGVELRFREGEDARERRPEDGGLAGPEGRDRDPALAGGDERPR